MFLREIKAENFRTLSGFNLRFDDYFTAICGKNNSGKTNVVKALRFLLAEDTRYAWDDRTSIVHKWDRTAWEPAAATTPISVEVGLELDHSQDPGLIEFLTKFTPGQLDIGATESGGVLVEAKAQIAPKDSVAKIAVIVGGHSLDEFSSQEVVKKIRSSRSCVYHNSTSVMRQRSGARSRLSLQASLPADRAKKLLEKQKSLTNEIDRCIVPYRDEISQMLGRLSERYEVLLNVPSLTVEELPFDISLGEKGFSVPLDEWGAGTRNRTMILRTLFEANQAAQSKSLSDKLTPIVVIEEPESFLHPLAQAEFGSVLQDLASEFRIQVIVTSHSPYMLSHKKENANVLLSRKATERKREGKKTTKTRETIRIPSTGADWKRPFEHALGVSGPELDYLKGAIFANAKEIVLVEGLTDKEYFDDLMGDDHGDERLELKGSVVSYEGAGTLKHGGLLKFVMSLFRVPIVTFDLDKDEEVSKTLERIGLQRDTDFFAVGRDLPGKRAIEGLLPVSVITGVTNDNPDVVMALASNSSDERRNAQQRFKRLCRERFKKEARPRTDSYSELYKLVRRINKAIREVRATKSATPEAKGNA